MLNSCAIVDKGTPLQSFSVTACNADHRDIELFPVMGSQFLKSFQRVFYHQEICFERFELRKHFAHYKIADAQFIEFLYISVSVVGLCLKGKEETLFRKRKPATVSQQNADGAILQVICLRTDNSDDFFY